MSNANETEKVQELREKGNKMTSEGHSLDTTPVFLKAKDCLF